MTKATNRLDYPVTTVASQTQQYVRHNVWTSAAVAFGMGVGTGLAIVSLLSDGRASHRTAIAERLGSQLLDAVRARVPSTWMPQ